MQFGQQNPFSGLAQAKISQSGTFMGSGFDGDVHPRRVWVNTTFDKGLCFFAEMEIITTNHPNHPVGQITTWIVKMQNPNALGNVKEFITGCCQRDPKNEQHIAELIPYYDQIMNGIYASADNNPCTQNPVHLMTKTKPKKKSQGFFTHHHWGPATGSAGAPPTTEDLQLSDQRQAAPIPQQGQQAQLPWGAAPQQPAAAPPWQAAPAAAPMPPAAPQQPAAPAAAPPWQAAPAAAPMPPAAPAWQPPAAPQAAPAWQPPGMAPAAPIGMPPVAAVPPPAGAPAAPQAPGFAQAPNPFQQPGPQTPPWQK